jgi:uncharacterized cupredoxin-like copper-binding protein
VHTFRKGIVVVAAAALAGLVVAVSALTVPALAGPGATPQRVAVGMSEFRFTVKPKTVRKGTPVVFALTNRGRIAHDFRIRGRKSPLVAAGKRGTLRLTFAKAGRYRYICTLPSHAVAGMAGTLVVR